MNITALLIFLFGLQIVCFYAAKKASKDLKNSNDYFLAGKSISFFPLMMTFLATQVGGGLILGACEEAYLYGWGVLLYPLGSVLGLFALAGGVGKRLSQLPVSTVAQIFEYAYGSKGLKQVASLLSVFSLFMIFVAQLIASQKLLISFGIVNPVIFFGFWILVIFYTASGGMKAVAATDVVQALFFTIVFCFAFGYLFMYSNISFLEVIQKSTLVGEVHLNESKVVGWLFLPLFFMLIEQDMAQRCFSGSCEKVVSWAAFVAGILTLILSVIPIYIGIFSGISQVMIPKGASVLMTTITEKTTPLVASSVGCAVLVAIVSTADSLLNAISANIAEDFEFLKKEGKKGVRVAQGVTLCIAALGMGASYFFDHIVDLLLLSYELSVSCLFIPVVAALYYPSGKKQSAFFSMILGSLSFLLFRFIDPIFSKELLSLVFSCLGFLIGELVFFRLQTTHYN